MSVMFCQVWQLRVNTLVIVGAGGGGVLGEVGGKGSICRVFLFLRRTKGVLLVSTVAYVECRFWI